MQLTPLVIIAFFCINVSLLTHDSEADNISYNQSSQALMNGRSRHCTLITPISSVKFHNLPVEFLTYAWKCMLKYICMLYLSLQAFICVYERTLQILWQVESFLLKIRCLQIRKNQPVCKEWVELQKNFVKLHYKFKFTDRHTSYPCNNTNLDYFTHAHIKILYRMCLHGLSKGLRSTRPNAVRNTRKMR